MSPVPLARILVVDDDVAQMRAVRDTLRDQGYETKGFTAGEEALAAFDAQATMIYELMEAKNHDYGEAWRDMRIASLTDLILQKVLRVKQIEDNSGATLVSEGVDANYMDMVNYAVFALILMRQG